ncbi:MAG: bifunctional 3-phosphoshikimate 1-carboxyvinyltransferase/cytidylate kinase, partial [Brachymonas sp.]
MYSTAYLDLPPLVSAQGTVQLPGSKSISNRVLLLAALSRGRTLIHDLLDSDDTRVMLAALQQLGCLVERSVAGVATDVAITGLGGHAPQGSASLFMGNAGTAMRPLTAALAVLGGDFTLSGVPRMHERPIGDLVDALRQLGCQIDYTGNVGFPPLKIGQPQLKLDVPITVRGDVSSQFLTALLLALPLVAKQDIHIDVNGELISKPYIEITLNLLEKFGIAVKRDAWKRFTIAAGSRYQSPGKIWVEADASSASYFIALGAISMPAIGSKDSEIRHGIRIEGLSEHAIQGDIRFIDAARQMGAVVTSGANHLDITRGIGDVVAIQINRLERPSAASDIQVVRATGDDCAHLPRSVNEADVA